MTAVVEAPCDACGRPITACICPECPVCAFIGDLRCYQDHGLEYTVEQSEGRAKLLAERQKQ